MTDDFWKRITAYYKKEPAAIRLQRALSLEREAGFTQYCFESLLATSGQTTAQLSLIVPAWAYEVWELLRL
jgi:hypothetical protein